MRHSNPKDVLAVMASMRAAEYAGLHQAAARQDRPVSFFTISRQAGAFGRTFAGQLADRLNELDPGELPWTVWDNELVERVAQEHQLPIARIASLEDDRPTWLEAAIGGLTSVDWPDELSVFHRVAETIRALAAVGRVIIVGRGGVFVTRDMPGGVHLRLVAPEEFRIEKTASAMGITKDAAAAAVREKDANRALFYRRHWPSRPLVPEAFSATFNTAAVPTDLLVECVLPLLRLVRPAGAAAPAQRRQDVAGVNPERPLKAETSAAPE